MGSLVFGSRLKFCSSAKEIVVIASDVGRGSGESVHHTGVFL